MKTKHLDKHSGGGCLSLSGLRSGGRRQTSPRLIALCSLLLTYCGGGQCPRSEAETLQSNARSWAPQLERGIDGDYPHLDRLYRALHAHPELSHQESRTAARMAQELSLPGFEVTTGVGGHGVVALLRNGPGPTVMIRADMDGLPVTEATGAPFASTVQVTTNGRTTGVMHACGHDVHMTVLVGTARQLHRLRRLWSGTLLLVAQPAEEVAPGAQAMIDDGLFERFPRPEVALALHTDAELAAGKIGMLRSAAMANVTTVELAVHGRGGHGAYPHRTIDPIVLSAQIIMALQTVVSRHVAPTDAAVVTVGSIHGGNRPNIIPETVTLELSLRSHRQEVRQQVIQSIRRLAHHHGRAAGLPEELLPTMVIRATLPAVINDSSLAQQALRTTTIVLGSANVVDRQPSMGGEDFAVYGAQQPQIPLLLFRLGTVSHDAIEAAAQGQPLPGLHSPHFLPDREPTLRTGVTAMTTIALDMLDRQRTP
jgi:hippurate hydrolase